MLNIQELETNYEVKINTNLYDDGDVAVARYCLSSQSIELSKEAIEGDYNLIALLYHELGHHEDMMLPEVHKRYFSLEDGTHNLYAYAFELVAFMHSLRLAKQDGISDSDYADLIDENEFNMEYYTEQLGLFNYAQDDLDFCISYINNASVLCRMSGVDYDFGGFDLVQQ